ncbi:MAG TPA: GNAT family N-acetyltransferase [Pseudomonadales bacterium]|nr:GNAT family N-acetyltransferase [Pseudomonadales bacterium]
MKAPEFHDTITVGDTEVQIRTMHPQDREIEVQFVRNLSPQSRYYRFHAAIKELTPSMLEHFTNVNYPDEMALIATVTEDGVEREIGVARYVRLDSPVTAEFAIVVADEFQGKGVGTRLLLDLRSCAIAAGITDLKATVLSENRRMYEFCRKLGFEVEPRHNDYSTVELGKHFEGTRFATGRK